MTCDVLAIDSDPAFLREAAHQIAKDGHRAWGARDLIAAMNFLGDRTPHAIVVELALLDSDGADPLGDLRDRAPDAPLILTAPGPPDERLREQLQHHEIFAYHDKHHGPDALRVWVHAALARIQCRQDGSEPEGNDTIRWV